VTISREPLDYFCPKCKARKGRGCVYVLRPVGPYQQPDPRAGTPTKRPHNERLQKITNALRREALAAWQERHADRYAAERQALGALARQEDTQLREWLRQHGRVLMGAGSA
jgi:hypothetical protein